MVLLLPEVPMPDDTGVTKHVIDAERFAYACICLMNLFGFAAQADPSLVAPKVFHEHPLINSLALSVFS